MNEETYQKILAIAKGAGNLGTNRFGVRVNANGDWEQESPNCKVCIVSSCLLGKKTLDSIITQFANEFDMTINDVRAFINGFDEYHTHLFIGYNSYWQAGSKMRKELGIPVGESS